MPVNDIQIFEAVADALVSVPVPDRVKTHILAATMDMVGVPMMSVVKYKADLAIVALFASRGVTLRAEGEGR
jgi:hypothetical protein